MNDRLWQLAGLGGFVVSGLFFLVSGIRAGDSLVIIGCLAWLVGCGAWGMPLVRSSEPGDR